MKKVYEKPQIYIESFELSQHIAACAWDMNAAKAEVCSADSDHEDFGLEEGLNIFVDADICQITTDVESYCYTNSDSNMTLFNS